MFDFKKPGEYDEDSVWYGLLDPQTKALDQIIKAQRQTQAALAAAAPIANTAQLQLRVVDLESKVMALALYSRTLLQLLIEKNAVTTEEFATRLRDLDLLDGKLDNR